MKKLEGRYHYRECGLDNVYLENGVYVTKVDGEDCYSIVDVEGLHRAIGRTIATSPVALGHKEFRFLRVELGYTQQMLADALGVDVQTIANYEKKKTAIPVPTDRLFRILYLQKEVKLIENQLRDLKAVIKDIEAVLHGMVQKTTRKTSVQNIFHLSGKKNWKPPVQKKVA